MPIHGTRVFSSPFPRSLSHLQLKGKATNAAVDIESVDESRPFIEMVRIKEPFVFTMDDTRVPIPLADFINQAYSCFFALPCH